MSEWPTYKDNPDRIRSLIRRTRANINCDLNFFAFSLTATCVEVSGVSLSVSAWIVRPDIVSLAIPGFFGALAIGSVGAVVYYFTSMDLERQRLRQLRKLV